MAKFPHLINIRGIENDAVDGTILKLSEGQAVRVEVSGSVQELIKVVSGKAHVLGEEVEVKSSSESKLVEAKSYTDTQVAAKLVEAKSYADQKITDLINGAPAMFDTLKEIADKLADGDDVATALAASIASEQSRAEAAEQGLASDLADEISRAEAAEAQALVDAKAYADTKKSEAQSYADAGILVEKNRAEAAESSLSSSISAEQTRAQAEEALMFKKDGSRTMTGGINMGGFGIGNLPTSNYPTTNGHASTKKYVDDKIAQEVTDRSSAVSGVQSNLDSEISRAQAAEAQALVDAKAYADVKKSEAQSYADAGILVEKNRAEAAEGVLTSSINTEKERIDAILLASDADKDSFAEIVSLINTIDTSNDEAFAAYVLSNNAALASEISRAETAESGLQSQIDSLSMGSSSALDAEISRAQAAEAQVLVDAKAYADTKKAELKSYSDNTFETKTAHNADKTQMQNTFSTEKALRESEEARIEGKIDSEISRAESAESALDGRIDLLEVKAQKKDKLVVSGSVPSYFDLQFKALPDSMIVWVGASILHEGSGEGYTLSEVGGVTRVTFNTNAISLNDKVFFYFNI